MKKATVFLFLAAALLGMFLAGFGLGRSTRAAPVHISAMPLAEAQPPQASLPRQEETKAGRVDVNTAAVSELEALPGIGPTLARRIVSYREENGPFESLEELMEVSGIGEAKLRALRDYVIVGGTQ